ncbi:hypothetical protein HYU95_03790 [Candidatus Daviesbacteria bacterium]|nr:hypothetical protein [Candidatus Daviesbacteria bacterium]
MSKLELIPCEWRGTRCPPDIYNNCIIRPSEKSKSPPSNQPETEKAEEPDQKKIFSFRGWIGSNITGSFRDDTTQSTSFSLVYRTKHGRHGESFVTRRCIASGQQSRFIRSCLDLGDKVIVVGIPTQLPRLGTKGQTRKAIAVIDIEPVV